MSRQIIAEEMAQQSRLMEELELAREQHELARRRTTDEELIEELRQRISELESRLNASP